MHLKQYLLAYYIFKNAIHGLYPNSFERSQIITSDSNYCECMELTFYEHADILTSTLNLFILLPQLFVTSY